MTLKVPFQPNPVYGSGSVLHVCWGAHLPAVLALIFVASILDSWVHSLVPPFPSTEKLCLSPVSMSPGAGCHVEKADTPEMLMAVTLSHMPMQGAELSTCPRHHPSVTSAARAEEK